MKNKNILIIMSAFLLVFTMLNVSATPPVTTVAYFPNGYNMQEAQQSFIPFGSNYTYHFQPYNNSNGVPITDEHTYCRILIVDNLGNELYAKNSTYEGGFSWYNNISSDIFYKIGEFPYKVDCLDGVGGSLTGTFNIDKPIVTDDGNFLLNLNSTVNIISLILFIIVIIVLIIFGQIGLGGLLTVILGFILLFSGLNFIISFAVIILGVFIIVSQK